MNAKRRIREWIAERLGKHFESLCWPQIACWALSYTSFWETFGVGGDAYVQKCRQDCPDAEWAYCGKCQATGRLFTCVTEAERKDPLNRLYWTRVACY